MRCLTGERRLMLAEYGAMARCIRVHRLNPGGPKRSGCRIAQKDERPESCLCRLGPPAGDRQIAPAAEALARRGQHHPIVPVGQKMRRRHRLGGASNTRMVGASVICTAPTSTSFARGGAAATSRGTRSCSSNSTP